MKESPENKVLREACEDLGKQIDELTEYDIRHGSIEKWLEMAKRTTLFVSRALEAANNAKSAAKAAGVEYAPRPKDREFVELLERFSKLGQRPRANDCMLCHEAIAQDDQRAPSTVNGGPAHMECVIRGAMGGANHIRKICRCFGGTLDPDPPGLTFRQAAIEAHKAWKETLA